MMAHIIVQSALNFDLFFHILLLIAGVLNHKFVKRTVLGNSPEDSLLSMQNSHQIVKFHQKTLMSHCKYPYLLVLLLVEEVLFDELLEKGETASVDVAPTFTFFAFVHSHIETCLVCVLFPRVERLTFENASASFTDEWGENGLDFFEMLGSAFTVIESGNGSSQIGHIDKVKSALLVSEVDSYSLSLFLPQSSQLSWLLSAYHTGKISLGLPMSGKQQSNLTCTLILFHVAISTTKCSISNFWVE
jgi:hypothetical protein